MAPALAPRAQCGDLRAGGLGGPQPGQAAMAPQLGRADAPGDARRSRVLYDRALRFARHKNYKGARRAFQTCVTATPDFSKAWVSWAQMEKRTDVPEEPSSLERCRRVLQRGLALNPTSAVLLQSWGLMELQRGNVLAAVLLLERCVQYEPKCSPVLQWRIVQLARESVAARLRRQPARAGDGGAPREPPAALS